MMTTTKSAPMVSTLALLVVVVAAALSATLSTAFVSPVPSVANVVVPKQQQYHQQQQHHHHTGSSGSRITDSNDRTHTSSRLYASTAPPKSGLAVIDSWKLLPDGRIKGVMSGSGDNVLTSPLKNKNGLKEKNTVRTVSGSRYKLGTPAAVAASASPADSKLSADRLGTPRATLGGNNSNNNVRATQSLNKSTPTASQDRVLQDYLANKERATTPSGSPFTSNNGAAVAAGLKKKNNFLTVRSAML